MKNWVKLKIISKATANSHSTNQKCEYSYVCMCACVYICMYTCTSVCVCSYVIPLLKMCFPHLSRFLYQLSLIPNFPQRLNCLLFSCTFADSASSMTHKLSTLQKACRSLRHSKPVSSYMYMSLRTTPLTS